MTMKSHISECKEVYKNNYTENEIKLFCTLEN